MPNKFFLNLVSLLSFLWFFGSFASLSAAPFNKVIESKNFKGVDLSIKGGKVFVESHKESNILVETKPISGQDTCVVSIREDASELEVLLDEIVSKDARRISCTDSLLVKLPEHLYVDVKTLHSDGEIKGSFLNVEYESRAGSLVADIKADSVEVSTSSGSINLKVFEETEIDLDSTAGNIEVEIKTSISDKNVNAVSKDKDAKIRTQSGSVAVYIGEKSFQKYKFEIESNRGQIKNDFVAQTSQDSKVRKESFKIKTAAGDIKIINTDKK